MKYQLKAEHSSKRSHKGNTCFRMFQRFKKINKIEKCGLHLCSAMQSMYLVEPPGAVAAVRVWGYATSFACSETEILFFFKKH